MSVGSISSPDAFCFYPLSFKNRVTAPHRGCRCKTKKQEHSPDGSMSWFFRKTRPTGEPNPIQPNPTQSEKFKGAKDGALLKLEFESFHSKPT